MLIDPTVFEALGPRKRETVRLSSGPWYTKYKQSNEEAGGSVYPSIHSRLGSYYFILRNLQRSFNWAQSHAGASWRSLVQQRFTEHLLCPRHCSKCWDYGHQQTQAKTSASAELTFWWEFIYREPTKKVKCLVD